MLLRIGDPLPQDSRDFFETRFGADFSDVRIHTDELAQETSAGLMAHAFATDNHIAFGRGEFQPNTEAGKHLIAHELTHVVQQRGSQPLDEPEELSEGPYEPELRQTILEQELAVRLAALYGFYLSRSFEGLRKQVALLPAPTDEKNDIPLDGRQTPQGYLQGPPLEPKFLRHSLDPVKEMLEETEK